MSKLFDYITEEIQDFIAAQHLFFIGSAPLSPTGHVNLSPKGLESFRVLSPNRVGYLDLTGSGNETSAHLPHVSCVFTVKERRFYRILQIGTLYTLCFCPYLELVRLSSLTLKRYRLLVVLAYHYMNIEVSAKL
jgi:hypothetical protein